MRMSFFKRKFDALLVILFVAALACGTVRAQDWQGTLAQHDYDTTVVVSVNPKLQPFRFHIIATASYDTTGFSRSDEMVTENYTFVVMNESGTDTIQILGSGTMAGLVPWTFDDVFHVEDINLDGYKDFRCLVMSGATTNPQYDYFLYDTATGKFVEDIDLEDLVSPSPDSARKEIDTFDSGGLDNWISSSYRLVDGKPQLVDFMTCECLVEKNLFNPKFDEKDSSNYNEYEYWKVENGDTVEVRRAVMTDEQFDSLSSNWWK